MTSFTLRNRVPDVLGRSALDHIFTNFFKDPHSLIKQSTEGYPLTDIYNDEEGNQIIEMALAGFSKDQIDIEVLDNRIIIGSSIKQNKEEQIQDMEEAFSALESEFDNLPVSTYKRRIARRQFKKTFVDYDNQLDLENCEASFVDGLLRITIRKDKETALKKIIIK